MVMAVKLTKKDIQLCTLLLDFFQTAVRQGYKRERVATLMIGIGSAELTETTDGETAREVLDQAIIETRKISP